MYSKTLRFLFSIAVATFVALTIGCQPAPVQGDVPPDRLKLSVMSLSASVDLAEVTFTYSLKATNRSANVGMQIYAHRLGGDGGDDKWELVSPTNANGSPLILNLYQGTTVSGKFTVTMPPGNYAGYRLLLFRSPDGKVVDYGNPIFDTAENPNLAPNANLHARVETSQSRVKKPTLVVGEPVVTERGNGKYEVVIPGAVHLPADYNGSDPGFWVMAKGSAGFSQVYADMKNAEDSHNARDPYKRIAVQFHINDVKSGVSNVQYGLFRSTWGDPIQWLWPGTDIEAGGDAWVHKAPDDAIPMRVRVKAGHFVSLAGHAHTLYDSPVATRAVKFARGGNYGNAIIWTIFPQLNTPGYFTLLREMGCRYMRFNFNPDRYAAEPLYQHAVDQVVQNILAAGLYPLISPQDLPKGRNLEQRIDRGLAVVKMMAEKYAGQSVWLEICNEPQEFDTWADWKPVAERYVKAIREIDPNALVVVPFEKWSKDGRGAAKDPITSVAVDLYDGHAYLKPDEIKANFSPAANLPLLIGEYGGNDPAFLHSIDRTLQDLPGVVAAGPWAFTVKGQDTLPLIENGDTAELSYTPSGRAIADDYAAWNRGRRL